MPSKNLMETEKNKILAVALLGAGLLVGYLWGVRSETKIMEQKIRDLESSLNVFVPPLPDIVNAISGTVTQKDGDTVTIQIPSLTERYPKPGQPAPTETKTVRVTAETKITATDFSSAALRADGIPQTKIIRADDMRVGDIVSVTVRENARTEQNTTAITINKTGGM